MVIVMSYDYDVDNYCYGSCWYIYIYIYIKIYIYIQSFIHSYRLCTKPSPGDDLGCVSWHTKLLQIQEALREARKRPSLRRDIGVVERSDTADPRQIEANPEGPSTQYLGTLVPKTMPLMGFGSRVPKSWVLGPSEQ